MCGTVVVIPTQPYGTSIHGLGNIGLSVQHTDKKSGVLLML